MNTRDLGRVALKVLGVYWGVSAIVSLLPALSLLGMPTESFLDVGSRNSMVAWSLAGMGVMAVAAVLLVAKGDALAERLFPEGHAAARYGETRSLIHVGVAVVGVALAASGLPDLVQLVAKILWYLGGERRVYFWEQIFNSLSMTGSGVLAFLVGITVAVRAERIAALLVRERRVTR